MLLYPGHLTPPGHPTLPCHLIPRPSLSWSQSIPTWCFHFAMYAIASEHWRGSPCALTHNWFAVPAKCPLHVYTGSSTIECKVDKHDPELQQANVRCQHVWVGHWSGALVRFTCCDGSQVPRRYLLSSLQAPLSELLGALHCALN